MNQNKELKNELHKNQDQIQMRCYTHISKSINHLLKLIKNEFIKRKRKKSEEEKNQFLSKQQ
ncbi:hypothetical protein TTHERM_00283040 (macronuclear) [Tetrahymena thermophila SB210]|uniref:Uncharacterized protein n=1 Tax=Tetrahymena thermophila (strain SB210) TaxID=312017 RepID=I7MK97_TETTS|nr:hypothetical protein TTHERM_00283040 [Tetrahymena thermophila SB210]EAR97916.1 hypothetical protein TTHERM_00283040 [Tetrahymena thermophila SB210]|eukprot:XP_001018161.1 hypothetical protein TTHERM_00283040 [Tetrahymena thermophila SB210]